MESEFRYPIHRSLFPFLGIMIAIFIVLAGSAARLSETDLCLPPFPSLLCFLTEEGRAIGFLGVLNGVQLDVVSLGLIGPKTCGEVYREAERGFGSDLPNRTVSGSIPKLGRVGCVTSFAWRRVGWSGAKFSIMTGALGRSRRVLLCTKGEETQAGSEDFSTPATTAWPWSLSCFFDLLT